MKTHNKTISLVLAFLITWSFLSSSISFALYSNYIPVTPTRQWKPNWCWAACDEIAGNYRKTQVPGTYGNTRTQYDVVLKIFGNYNDQSATLSQTAEGQRYVGYYNFAVNPYYGTYSYSDLCTFVDLRKPLIAGMVGTGIGHALLFVGYTNNSNFPDNCNITFIDPGDGWSHKLTYGQLKAGVYNNMPYKYSVFE